MGVQWQLAASTYNDLAIGFDFVDTPFVRNLPDCCLLEVTMVSCGCCAMLCRTVRKSGTQIVKYNRRLYEHELYRACARGGPFASGGKQHETIKLFHICSPSVRFCLKHKCTGELDTGNRFVGRYLRFDR